MLSSVLSYAAQIYKSSTFQLILDFSIVGVFASTNGKKSLLKFGSIIASFNSSRIVLGHMQLRHGAGVVVLVVSAVVVVLAVSVLVVVVLVVVTIQLIPATIKKF